MPDFLPPQRTIASDTGALVSIAFVIILMVSCSGCSMVRAAAASLRSTSDFVVLQSDPRIHYEAGAKDIANIVAENLDKSIQTVESKQYLPFARSVEVMVFASYESYVEYTGQKARATQIGKRIWLSGRFK